MKNQIKTPQQEEAERQYWMNAPGKLSVFAFRKQFKFNINYGMADIQVDRIANKSKYGYVIDYDVYLPSKGMNLQRGFVWTLEQKQEFIISILKGITIAPITVILFKSEGFRQNEGRGLYRVIDGKQRLSTAISFYEGGFSIPFEGKNYFYNDLTEHAKHTICHCFTANIGYEYPDNIISDEDKIAWFEMINFAGTPQDKNHIEKLRK